MNDDNGNCKASVVEQINIRSRVQCYGLEPARVREAVHERICRIYVSVLGSDGPSAVVGFPLEVETVDGDLWVSWTCFRSVPFPHYLAPVGSQSVEVSADRKDAKVYLSVSGLVVCPGELP